MSNHDETRTTDVLRPAEAMRGATKALTRAWRRASPRRLLRVKKSGGRWTEPGQSVTRLSRPVSSLCKPCNGVVPDQAETRRLAVNGGTLWRWDSREHPPTLSAAGDRSEDRDGHVATVTAPEMVGLLAWWSIVLAAPVVLLRRRRRRRRATAPHPPRDRPRRPLQRPGGGRGAETLTGHPAAPGSASMRSDKGPRGRPDLWRRASGPPADCRGPTCAATRPVGTSFRPARLTLGGCRPRRSSLSVGTSTSGAGSSSRRPSCGPGSRSCRRLGGGSSPTRSPASGETRL